jgi:hypothetical protein
MEVSPRGTAGASDVSDEIALFDLIANTDRRATDHMCIQGFHPVVVIDVNMVTITPVIPCSGDDTAVRGIDRTILIVVIDEIQTLVTAVTIPTTGSMRVRA